MTFSGNGTPAPPLQQGSGAEIAIIGVSGKFADTDHYWDYWDNIFRGRYIVHPINKQRMEARSNMNDITPESHYKTLKSTSSGIALELVGLTEKEFAELNPGQRFALKLAYRTIEDARMLPDGIKGSSTGVWIACGQEIPGANGQPGKRSAAAGLISRCFNLRESETALNAVCNSFAFSIVRSSEQLQSGEIDMALAGVICPDLFSLQCAEAFQEYIGDSVKEGVPVWSHIGANRITGSGMVLLKPLEKAVLDGNTIRGVISMNNSGQPNNIPAEKSAIQEGTLLSSTEQLILGVWKKYFQQEYALDAIGMDDDYFEIGGNSVLTVMIEYGMERKNIPISASDFNKYNTIRKQAQLMEKRIGRKAAEN